MRRHRPGPAAGHTVLVQLPPDSYGAHWSADYDELMPIPEAATAATVERLTELAAGGPVLEVAAGTGRLAIPLAERGLPVTAADSSVEMLDRLAAKDANGLVTRRVEALPEAGGGPFRLVACVYSCITVLSSQAEQLAFVRNAAAALESGGHLVIETLLVDPRTFVEARPLAMTADALMARFGRYDVVTQVLDQYYLIGRAGEPISIRPDTGRMVTPAELDLMAELAGLAFVSRHADWTGTPVTGGGNTVSVYRKPA